MNQSDLIKYAFKTGKSVTLEDGTVINANKKTSDKMAEIVLNRMEKAAVHKEKVKPEPNKHKFPDYSNLIKSESEKSREVLEIQRDLIEQVSVASHQIMAMLETQQQLIRKMTDVVKRNEPGEWTFDVERGRGGLISKIVAKNDG